MSEFTPGPWVLDWGTTHAGAIANIHHTSQREGWAEIWSTNWPDEATQTANAHLIAAAPDMHKELSDLLEFLETLESDGDLMLHLEQEGTNIDVYIDDINKVLAKARGEP